MSDVTDPIGELERAAAAADHPLHSEYLRSMVGRGERARQELVKLDDLKPMRPFQDFASMTTKDNVKVDIEIADPNHFLRTLQFVDDNGLREEFWRPFRNLLNLLAQTGGVIWPDGQDVPSFVWRGAGMIGGFIFHRHARDWCIHT
jgi:hypothetical protein